MSWKQIEGNLVQLAVGRDEAWGIDAEDKIYRYKDGVFKQIPGLAMNVGVGADGTVWVVNRAMGIFSWNGFTWTKVDGFLVQISVGDKTHVMGVNNQNIIFTRSNGDINGIWISIAGSLADVSIASDGTTWGITKDKDVLRWDGISTWEIVNEKKLKQIYVSSQEYVVGVDDNNLIYQYVNNSWSRLEGSFNYIAISIDGTLWGIDSNNAVFTRPNNLVTNQPISPTTPTIPFGTDNRPGGGGSNDSNITKAIIGLSVGFGLTIVIVTIFIVMIMRRYKKSKILRIAKDSEEK
ncbi:hypothetical protein C1645_764264 [Glomus cerebriforme]|uniref:Regulator of chromosome condensation 1/beta-lactamase-inhibitor protein II n=1 Tax=Glomus cerebriforme TaxID=658196 RepID=A0A397TCU2_9GLOM|nr:hypothetical protein C1645_764264 [Glomus cerebriforme]